MTGTGWGGALALLLLGQAAPPRQPPASLAPLSRGLVCPERLPDDAARQAAATRFVEAYGRLRPKSHMGERLEYRARLLRERGCRAEEAQYSFPET